ncbi:MAG: hypothetical protein V7696_10085 [Halioglobus sp.]
MSQIKSMVILILLAFPLVGCKLVIEVPEGGRVVNQDNVEQCPASQVCVIEVVDTFFNQTFTAEPEDGYIFKGWRSRAGGQCGGSDGDCALFTLFFQGIPFFESILASNQEYYLEPIFEKFELVNSVECEQAPADSGINFDHIYSTFEAQNFTQFISGNCFYVEASSSDAAIGDLAFYTIPSGGGLNTDIWGSQYESGDLIFAFELTESMTPGIGTLDIDGFWDDPAKKALALYLDVDQDENTGKDLGGRLGVDYRTWLSFPCDGGSDPDSFSPTPGRLQQWEDSGKWEFVQSIEEPGVLEFFSSFWISSLVLGDGDYYAGYLTGVRPELINASGPVSAIVRLESLTRDCVPKNGIVGTSPVFLLNNY